MNHNTFVKENYDSINRLNNDVSVVLFKLSLLRLRDSF